MSVADNLVPADTNGDGRFDDPGSGPVEGWDIFVRDLREGTTERVSVATNGDEASGDSEFPSISADGRYVAFQSNALNLDSQDCEGGSNIFVRDRASGVTRCASVGIGGQPANLASNDPAISADGRFVAFDSFASNLVPDDNKSAGVRNVFVRDTPNSVTQRVSVGMNGEEPNADSYLPAISADGRFVAFLSKASNLVPGDTNNAPDAFLVDRLTGTTKRISVGDNGEQIPDGAYYRLAISGDGCRIAFSALDGIRVYDCNDGASQGLACDTPPMGARLYVSMSSDGKSVAFMAVSGPVDTNQFTDIFRVDVETKLLTLVTRSVDGGPSNGESVLPSLSGDGTVISFGSAATNLIPDDENSEADVFVVRPLPEDGCDDGDACTSDSHGSSGCRHGPIIDFDAVACSMGSVPEVCTNSGGRIDKVVARLLRVADRAAEAHREGKRRRARVSLQRIERLAHRGESLVQLSIDAGTMSPPCGESLLGALRDVAKRARGFGL